MRAGKYKKQLEKIYLEQKHDEGYPINKLQFLGNRIFDFITYDYMADELFAKKTLEVIECILNRTNSHYQKSRENYINYMYIVNTPFMRDKLEWGSSIRGAWFDDHGHDSESAEDRVYLLTHDWRIAKSEINHFMKQLLEWVAEGELEE